MEKTIYYNSSLPRAGSTLFQNIVGQNPEFYVTPTSGLSDFIVACRNQFSSNSAFKAQDQSLMKNSFLDFCKHGMLGFFERLTNKPYILDKSRGWSIEYGLVNELFPNPKMVCMVRDIRCIYSSMEKNYRKNPHINSGTQDTSKLIGTTLDKRIDIWADGIPVGISIDRLKDIIQQGIDKNILFIRYEDLLSNPNEEIKRFYDYLGLDFYGGHNFNEITQLTHENDVAHGIYGDHKLRTEFKKLPDDYNQILGVELSQKIKNTYPWFFEYFGYV